MAVETDIALRDGSTVHVRPVEPSDADALAAFYGGLSEESRVFRFFSAAADLRAAGKRSAEAREGRGLVASIDGRDQIVGHAEFMRFGVGEAEVAFAVSDAWQGHGISTLLMAQLAEMATADGVSAFSAVVMPGNHRMVGVFRSSGFPVEVRSVEGELEITFPTALDADGRRRFEDRERMAAIAAVRHVLCPSAIAVIGPSDTPGTPAAVVRDNLLAGGFCGGLHVVPDGRAAIPAGMDLAVVAVAPEQLLEVAQACASAGVRAMAVVSEGSAAAWDEGARARAELLAVCRAAGMRLLGPGSLGVHNADAAVRLHATLASEAPLPGRVAFASQSAALGLVAMGVAAAHGVGLSSFVSLGDKADLSGNDILEYLDQDAGTDVVALYLESFGNPRKFGRIAHRVTARKPVVVVKSGRSTAGAEVGGSHARALVTSEAGVDALFRHAGVIRTDTVDELFGVAGVLTRQPLPRGDGVAVVANARGPGVVCADACLGAGLRLAQLSDDTRAAVRAAAPRATAGNPMDLASGATAAQFGRALDAVLADPSVDAVVTIFVPRLAASPVEVLEAVRGACARGGDVPVVPVFLAAEGLAPDPALPVHGSVEEAARSLAHAVGYSRHRSAPADPVPGLPGVDADQAAGLIAEGLADGRGWLSRPAVEALLACYGIPRAPSRWASSPRGVREAAAALGGRVAVKASAPGLQHRTQAGAVRLDLTPAGAERGARDMRAALGASGMRVDGWLVQRMAAPGPELLAGAVSDPQFGPLVVVGAGGAAAELMRDVQVRLAPVGPRGASDMVRGLRIRPFLEGHRGAEPVDLSAVGDLVVRIGAMAAAHPQLAELECHPVIASASGVAVVDSRARLGPSPGRRPLGALDR